MLRVKIDADRYTYFCPKDKYNSLATLFFNTEGTIIKNFLNKDVTIGLLPNVVFALVWFLLTTITYGTAVPAGLFLPGILIGCAMGRGFGHLI